MPKTSYGKTMPFKVYGDMNTYWCKKCKRRHRFSSKIGREHELKYMK